MERQPDRRRDLPRKQLSFGLASSTLALSAPGCAPDPVRNRVRLGLAGRLLPHPLATTQLVDGACLIRRYCAVRSRGGQLWRDKRGLEMSSCPKPEVQED